MFSTKRIGVTTALVAGALALTSLAAPTASAAPVTVASFSPLIGIGTVGTGSSATPDAPVYSSASVTLDTQEAGVSRFVGGGPFCKCLVKWRNLDTGASGTSLGGGPFIIGGNDPYFAVTGSGSITATMVVSNGITLLPGSATWEVP